MKRAAKWLSIGMYGVLLAAMLVMGVKIFDHNYEVIVEGRVAMVSFWTAIVCTIVYKLGAGKCPHCGKVRLGGGKYCSRCGKDVG